MLTIHRAARAERLVEALASVVIDPLDDPFTPEVVAVPTRGIERWLSQRLSTVLGASPDRQDGVCANVEFPFPGRLVGGALAAATGIEPDDDPWLPERSVWPLMAVVDEHLDDAWLAMLAAHLGGPGPDHDETRRARRFGAVRHVADLFDRYAVHRPAMIEAWAAGDDTDGLGQPLPADVAWQAALWRCLRARLSTPSPAERLATACARLRADPAKVDLPRRLSLFGLTRLPVSYVEVLDAIASARDVNLFLLHPSPVLWDQIAQAQPSARRRLPRRRDDPTAALPSNPLLATWGRDAREMQLVLAAAGDGATRADRHWPVVEQAVTLLGRIQADVRADRLAPGPPLPGQPDSRALLDPSDRSLQVHACHGRARQVEVLRDTILHQLADDPTLEPRDLIVMCPDIEAFAPLLQATFGAGELDPPGGETKPSQDGMPDLRFRLADRSLRQTNPVLSAVAELLDLADTRVTASQVIDFASSEPVRRRFHLDDDDLARVEEWVAATGIRWGLDAAHRAPYRLDQIGSNTWRAGLDRVLLGVTMAEDELRLVGGVLPLDDVGSGDIDLAGRLAELLDRLGAAVTLLSQPRPVEAWAEAIASAADALTATSERGDWQRRELERILRDIVTEAGQEATDTAMPLALAEIRAVLADRLRGRPTRANFRTGHLTMCTLVPMRSVPHRVVCLLGLDDGMFPRRTAPDGDDIIERAPCVGDRDLRSEDRQLLLDALLAATDHLVITFSGRDERTNAVRPPAVPLGELLDIVDRTARIAAEPSDGGPSRRAREQIVTHHPLQTFDVRNFVTGALVPRRPWSFDTAALGGAQASVADRSTDTAFLSGPLPAVDTGLVELDDLVWFVQHPVKAFLRQRLGISVSDVEEEPEDGLPVELDALQRWSVGQRLLDERLAGIDLDACLVAETVRGILPPGELGAAILDEVLPTVEDILCAATAAVDETAETASVEVDIDLGDGRALVGTVPGVVGDVLRTATFSRVGPKQRLAAWVRLLALAAAHPERPFSAVTVGRGKGDSYGLAYIAALGADAEARRRDALEQLRVLVDLHAGGMREPLPLYCKTSAAYAGAKPASRVNKARSAWETARFDGEDREPEHQLVLGGIARFDDLLVAAPTAHEDGPGWPADESTRFGRCARRLWDGLLAVEKRSNL
jgi:exodeoxyribonuclease V gamma subunit